nr:ORF101 [Acipenserid herpesvirus 1]
MLPVNHTISYLDLGVFQTKVTLQDGLDLDVRVYIKDPTQYLTCHMFIYDWYLAAHAQLCTINRVNYIYLNLTLKDAQMFLTCLYMHYLGWIDDKGVIVTFHAIKHRSVTYDLVNVAYLYHLNWLCLLFDQILEKVLTNALYLMDNKLVHVNEHKLTITATPPHTKSFTTSPCGRHWYALCASQPDVLQLWTKETLDTKWSKLTQVTQRVAANSSVCAYYDPTLTENTHLYVLQDGKRLSCYNLQTNSWSDIVCPSMPPRMTYNMTRSKSGSLQLTLVADVDVFHGAGARRPQKVINLNQEEVAAEDVMNPPLNYHTTMEVIRVALRGCKRNLIDVPLTAPPLKKIK